MNLDPPTLSWTVNGETVATVTGSVVTWHVAFTRENADALLRIAADYIHKSAADHATEVARLRGIADRAFDETRTLSRQRAIANEACLVIARGRWNEWLASPEVQFSIDDMLRGILNDIDNEPEPK